MVLMIDNFDSFTYNIVHYLEELGAHVKVFRNNQITLTEVETLAPSHIVISPGPGGPERAGISQDIVRTYKDKLPMLGVCLGLQCMGAVLGGRIVRSEKILHGKTSKIYHQGTGLFKDVKSPFLATRYHSLILARTVEAEPIVEKKPSSLASSPSPIPANTDKTVVGFDITAWTEDDEIMGVHHRTFPLLCGVQFHPESIASEYGHVLLKNFLALSS